MYEFIVKRVLFLTICILSALYSAPDSSRAAGALAIDEKKGDQWGWAVNYPTLGAAEKEALEKCGKGCKIVQRFSSGCAAYVADQSAWSTVYGWAKADDMFTAESLAQEACKKQGGWDCLTRVKACDSKKAKPKKKKNKKGSSFPQSTVTKQGDNWVKRVFFEDFRRCSAWCPEAIPEAEFECGRNNKMANIISCNCNERKKPYYADVVFACEAAKKVACTKTPQTVVGPTRMETVYFKDFRRCSAWCPEAIPQAKAICANEGFSTKINSCNCNERKKPYYAKVNFACTKTVDPCKRIGVKASLMLLIDVSGSMKGKKMSAAKSAARDAIKRALSDKVEVAVLAFSGSCSSPITKQQDFTTDENTLLSFINSLQADGKTPLSTALKAANEYFQKDKAPNSKTQMIVLLADGDDSCGNIDGVMAELKSKGIIFRHETVGLDIDPNSDAARQLQKIATKSGGNYHYAKNHAQLASVFKEAVDTMAMLDMLGQFGKPDTDKTDSKNTDSKEYNSTQSIFDQFK